MAKSRKIRLFLALGLMGCLLAGVNACQSEPGVPAASPVLSRIQNAFISKNGLPDLFAVTFDGARRIDSWIYFGTPQRMVVFDDGLFMEEKELSANPAEEQRTQLKPADFTAGLVQGGITARFGQPDDLEEATIDGKRLTIMRYAANDLEPLKSFGFIDNSLFAVTVGFNFAGAK